jgi:hypothetical protein
VGWKEGKTARSRARQSRGHRVERILWALCPQALRLERALQRVSGEAGVSGVILHDDWRSLPGYQLPKLEVERRQLEAVRAIMECWNEVQQHGDEYVSEMSKRLLREIAEAIK